MSVHMRGYIGVYGSSLANVEKPVLSNAKYIYLGLNVRGIPYHG